MNRTTYSLEEGSGPIRPNSGPPKLNSGQLFPGSYVQWIPVQVQPVQNAMGSMENNGPGGGQPSNPGQGPGWSFPNQANLGPLSFPYPNYGPGYFPFAGLTGNWLEPGDPLYMTAANGPKLRLISQQISAPENYSLCSRELWRVLIMKDKEGFINSIIPARH